MNKTFQIRVFGKTGCDKCKVLNRRLERLLDKEAWTDVEKHYVDVESEDGLIDFCRAQCLNPGRIPALLVMRRSDDGVYQPVPNPSPGGDDPVCGASKLYQYLGLQTDYAEGGNGVITPAMIKAVVNEARQN